MICGKDRDNSDGGFARFTQETLIVGFLFTPREFVRLDLSLKAKMIELDAASMADISNPESTVKLWPAKHIIVQDSKIQKLYTNAVNGYWAEKRWLVDHDKQLKTMTKKTPAELAAFPHN